MNRSRVCTIFSSNPGKIIKFLRDYEKSQEDKVEAKSIKTRALIILWLFIIVGIGGCLFSCIGITYTFGINPISIPVLVMDAIYLTLCVMTLIAFHKQKSNAISLAINLASVSIITFFCGLVYRIVVDTFTPVNFCQIIFWGAIAAYLYFSENLDIVIPKETRTWGKTEKWLVGIYACYARFSSRSCCLRSKSPTHILPILLFATPRFRDMNFQQLTLIKENLCKFAPACRIIRLKSNNSAVSILR